MFGAKHDIKYRLFSCTIMILRFEASALEYSSTVLSVLYSTLPTSAQLQYDVCCLWRRNVELRGRAAAQPRIPRDALLGALRRQARGSRRLWQLGARSRRRTLAHLPAGTLHSTVYTLQQGFPDLVGSRPKNLGLKTTKGPNSKF